MKVYVVIQEYYYETRNIIKILKSEEEADELADKLFQNNEYGADKYNVEEWDVE